MPEKVTFNLSTNFALGDYSSSLSSLTTFCKDRIISHTSAIDVDVWFSNKWIDISLLSYIAHTIVELDIETNIVTLHFDTKRSVRGRYNFFWSNNFWNIIKANRSNSNITAFPDPFIFASDNFSERLNFTPLIHFNLKDKLHSVEQVVYDFKLSLESCYIYDYIKTFDVIFSKEYLYFLIWELIDNAHIHSSGNHVTIAGQVFASKSLCRTFPAGFSENLEFQYNLELDFCKLSQKKNWLIEHKNEDFLLLSCVDSGIGIPESLKRKGINFLTDSDAIMLAFDREFFLNSNKKDYFEVHGLSQIKQLVLSYDGYLFLQSGCAVVECTNSGTVTQMVAVPDKLNGTIIQILLPLRNQSLKHLSTSKIHYSEASPQVSNTDNIKHVYKHFPDNWISLIDDYNNWPDIIDNLLKSTSCVPTGPQILDFTCMPRNRQFISYLIRAIRTRCLNNPPAIVNASDELFGIISSLPRADNEHFVELDFELSTALSRGKGGGCLPLLIPISCVNVYNNKVSLYWIGLSGLVSSNYIHSTLSNLYNTDQLISYDELWFLLTQSHPEISQAYKEEYLSLFKSIIRANSIFFQFNETYCKCIINEANILFWSIEAQKRMFKELTAKMLHKRPYKYRNYLYDLGWHEDSKRFRVNYYRTWDILSSKENLEVCADLLLRQAYLIFGEELLETFAIVSVTPSAGLLGRKIADVIGALFFEVPSIYDLETTKWLPDLKVKKVLIVDDVFDTGTLTKRIIGVVSRSNGNIFGILTLLKNTDNEECAIGPHYATVFVDKISLGIPTRSAIEYCIKNNHYYEIDTNTLEPIPIREFSREYKNKTIASDINEILTKLLPVNALFSGHFVYGYHHYSIYYSLSKSLSNSSLKEELLRWLTESIVSFCKSNNTTAVTIVYPYYSPIYLLIDIFSKSKLSKDISITYVVAKPQERSANRRGYSLPNDELYASYEYTIFIDDGITTGSTISDVITELISHGANHILGLIIFDRIGLNSRKHLKSINSYKTSSNPTFNIDFTYSNFVSANLRTYSESDCPVCKAYNMFNFIDCSFGVLHVEKDNLISIIEPIFVGQKTELIRSNLTNVELNEVITFFNAAYTDLASKNELFASIANQRRNTNSVLTMLTTILHDRKFDRQFLNRIDLINVIVATLLHTDTRQEERIRFIINIPFWKDKIFSIQVFKEVLPCCYDLYFKEQSISKLVVEDYFDHNQIEFASIIFTLRTLKYLHNQDITLEILTVWKSIFSYIRNDQEHSSIYLFELFSALHSDSAHPIEVARFMVNNFHTSYSERHVEAIKQRMRGFIRYLKSGNCESARERMPKSLFLLLLNSIKLIQSFYILDTFNDAMIQQLTTIYERLNDPSTHGEITDLLELCFISNDRDKPMVTTLIEQITPQISTVIDAAKTQFDIHASSVWKLNTAPTININYDESSQLIAFCKEDFLIHTVSHLLRNPCEKKIKNGQTELLVDLNVCIDKTDDSFIELNFIDDYELTQVEIDNAFRKGGGLSAQQYHIKQWGGKLYGNRIGNKNIFTLLIPRTFI